MITIISKTEFNFIGKRYIFFAISGILLLSGIASLVIKKGPKWGLDFTGGTLLEVKFKNPPPLQEIRKILIEKETPSFEIQSVPDEGIFIIRTQLLESAAETSGPGKTKRDIGKEILNAMRESFPGRTPIILRKEFVGPTVGRHLFKQTALAFTLTFIGIIIYVAFRFHSGIWGVSGVLAIVHDVLAMVGIFSLLDKEITVTVVAAFLTIAGYSINDTIVIFDYMREKLRLLRTEPLSQVINKSINATLSRTIVTSLTLLLVVLTLFFFGGEVIHDFAFAMVIGSLIGTYSSIGIATPIIFEWERINNGRK